jgi:hypothetical protein
MDSRADARRTTIIRPRYRSPREAMAVFFSTAMPDAH